MLTIVIPTYNGGDVLKETIKQAHKHVRLDQIIVVSDASTDNTAEIARRAGVRVIVNKRNLQKARSINAAMPHVRTPYVLLLDDDTLIGETFIPTSLLDEGYTAVAFNVMPLKEDRYLTNSSALNIESVCKWAKTYALRAVPSATYLEQLAFTGPRTCAGRLHNTLGNSPAKMSSGPCWRTCTARARA